MPQDQIVAQYLYIHNVFGHFYKDTLNWLSYIYPRFNWKVLGTYEKSVEYLNKLCEFGRETDKPLFPALILNPTGDFTPADAIAGGRQLWRYPTLAPSFVKRVYDPIYQDQNILVTPGFIRIKGDMEVIIMTASFYEYCDIRMFMLNTFGGLDRVIYPLFFNSFIVLPQEFLDYEYYNEYTKLRYKIDWETTDAYKYLVRTIAQDKLVVPLRVKPQYSLVSISDGSTRYGGSDNLPEWKLQATINFEIELPNYMVLESDYLTTSIDFNIEYGSAFSIYHDFTEPPPDYRNIITKRFKTALDETCNTSFVPYPEALPGSDNSEYSIQARYFHFVTQEQVDSTANIVIDLPLEIDDQRELILFTYTGELDYGDVYLLSDDGKQLIIKRNKIVLTVDQVLELYVYKKV